MEFEDVEYARMSPMAQLSFGTPRKVLRLAASLGVHNDCLVAEVDGACDDCIDTMHLAHYFFYGNLETSEEKLEAIIRDIMQDREEIS